MTKDINQLGFKSIANHYDLFFIDIWGVIHNGIDIYDNAREVLSELKKLDKEFILLTNAPRPNKNVEEFLLKIGLDKIFTSKVYTSGEAALNYLISNYKYKYFYHIGPPRDFSIFKDFERQKIKNIKKADYLLLSLIHI